MRLLPIALSALCLSPLTLAQGTYTTSQTGCGALSVCDGPNGSATAITSQTHNSNIFAIGITASKTTRTVLGFELLTSMVATSGILKIPTEVYDENSLGGPGNLVAKGSMIVLPALGWYRTILDKPVRVEAGKRIFLSYAVAASAMYFPFASSGTKVTHFWHSSTATTWNGTPNGFQSQAWAYRLICANAPVISNTGVPTLGASFSVDLLNGAANAPGILALGVSNTQWGVIKLPLSLDPLNATGCNLYVSLDFLFLFKTDASGAHQHKFGIPNNSVFKGVKFFNQYAVEDKAANGFGVVFSDLGEGVAG